uniref:Uncharacterized protein n=2 Tax=Octopus bimaculoides TaxID=37653 RepID=A0A0L8GT66_OCTBM
MVEEPAEEESIPEEKTQQSGVKGLYSIAEEVEEPAEEECILEDEMQRFENLLKNFVKDINYAKFEHGRIMIDNEELDAFKEPL